MRSLPSCSCPCLVRTVADANKPPHLYDQSAASINVLHISDVLEHCKAGTVLEGEQCQDCLDKEVIFPLREEIQKRVCPGIPW